MTTIFCGRLERRARAKTNGVHAAGFLTPCAPYARMSQRMDALCVFLEALSQPKSVRTLSLPPAAAPPVPVHVPVAARAEKKGKQVEVQKDAGKQDKQARKDKPDKQDKPDKGEVEKGKHVEEDKDDRKKADGEAGTAVDADVEMRDASTEAGTKGVAEEEDDGLDKPPECMTVDYVQRVLGTLLHGLGQPAQLLPQRVADLVQRAAGCSSALQTALKSSASSNTHEETRVCSPGSVSVNL